MQKTSQLAPILSILPPREGFSPQAFGAVSLSVKDFTESSRYRERCHILGAVDAPAFDGLNYHCLPVKKHWYEPNRRAYLRAIAHWLREHPAPALIELHNRPLLAAALRRMSTAPIALHLHNDPQEMKAAASPAARRRLLRRVDAVYCISHWVRTRFLSGLPESAAHKVHTVHSGLELPETKAEKQPHIVFVGRMTPNKGGLECADAFARVLPEHRDWHGYMIGGRRHAVSAQLSDYERQIQQRMTQAGARAHFEGFYPYDKTQAAFARAAIVVIPSLWDEPFGRTALEAIAHGCAVVCSGRGGLSEIIGEAGVLLQDVTGETIAAALDELIRNDTRRAQLQQAARQQAEGFALTRCTQTLDALRAQLMQEETHHAA